MNIVLLDGGFGNQLFQVSYALYLSDVSKIPTAVNYSAQQKLQVHGIDGLEDIIRKLGLTVHSENGAKMRRLARLAVLRRSLATRKLFAPLNVLNGGASWGATQVYSGYWQEFTALRPYYSQVANACRDVFEITPGDRATIHARFGDYTKGKNAEIYAQTGEDYYLKALKSQAEQSDRAAYEVITNDPDAAKSLFLSQRFSDFSFTFKRGTLISDFADLAQSSALIGSNSTFCWWAALCAAHGGNLKNLTVPIDWFQPAYMHRTSPPYEYVQTANASVIPVKLCKT